MQKTNDAMIRNELSDEIVSKVVDDMVQIYVANDISIEDILRSEPVDGLTIYEAVKVYAQCMHKIERDMIIRMNPDENTYEALWLS